MFSPSITAAGQEYKQSTFNNPVPSRTIDSSEMVGKRAMSQPALGCLQPSFYHSRPVTATQRSCVHHIDEGVQGKREGSQPPGGLHLQASKQLVALEALECISWQAQLLRTLMAVTDFWPQASASLHWYLQEDAARERERESDVSSHEAELCALSK